MHNTSVNRGGAATGVTRNTRTRYEIMMAFDELPEEYRRVLRECPIQLELNPSSRADPALYEELMEQLTVKSCRATYGNEHPQAFGRMSVKTPVKREKVRNY